GEVAGNQQLVVDVHHAVAVRVTDQHVESLRVGGEEKPVRLALHGGRGDAQRQLVDAVDPAQGGVQLPLHGVVGEEDRGRKPVDAARQAVEGRLAGDGQARPGPQHLDVFVEDEVDGGDVLEG